MPLPTVYIYCSLIEIHKIKNSIQKHSDIHEHSTRNPTNLTKPTFYNTKSIKNTLDFNIYNHLPQNVKFMSGNIFKNLYLLSFLTVMAWILHLMWCTNLVILWATVIEYWEFVNLSSYCPTVLVAGVFFIFLTFFNKFLYKLSLHVHSHATRNFDVLQ